MVQFLLSNRKNRKQGPHSDPVFPPPCCCCPSYPHPNIPSPVSCWVNPPAMECFSSTRNAWKMAANRALSLSQQPFYKRINVINASVQQPSLQQDWAGSLKEAGGEFFFVLFPNLWPQSFHLEKKLGGYHHPTKFLINFFFASLVHQFNSHCDREASEQTQKGKAHISQDCFSLLNLVTSWPNKKRCQDLLLLPCETEGRGGRQGSPTKPSYYLIKMQNVCSINLLANHQVNGCFVPFSTG